MDHFPPLHHVVFRRGANYFIASCGTPDMHDGPHRTKLNALLVARDLQIKLGGDPNLVIDLTNVPDSELVEFLG